MFNCTGYWQGFPPPQRIFSARKFAAVALDPPNFEPGSWIGAGKAIYDADEERFLLTARPRKAKGGVRGFAAEIYASRDGFSYEKVIGIKKDEISEMWGQKVQSIEGTQLLCDPLSGDWFFYLSVDADPDFVWGGLYWQTLLLRAPEITGPWQVEGTVLENDRIYDAHQARDATIDIIDGRWYSIYKARDEDRRLRPALATSMDGICWQKRGPLTIDGEDRPVYLSGTIFAASCGPLFVGIERKEEVIQGGSEEGMIYEDEYRVGHGGGPPRDFVAYRIDERSSDLSPVFRARWEPFSDYEFDEQPLLGYASLVWDPQQGRMLIFVEAIDGQFTSKLGLNETVERVLVYVSQI